MGRVLKKAIKLGGIMLALMCMVIFASPYSMKTQAGFSNKLYTLIGLQQTHMTKNSITIKWTPSAGEAKYEVTVQIPKGQVLQKYTVTSCQLQINGLKQDTRYAVTVTPYDAAGDYGISGYEIVKTVPGEVKGFKVGAYWGNNSYRLNWDIQTGIEEGYEIEIYNGKNKRIKTKELSWAEGAFHLDNMVNHVYTARIRSFAKLDGTKYYSDPVSLQWVASPKVTKCKVSSGKLNVKWNKVSGATGYDIYVSTSKSKGYKKVKSVGKNTSSIKVSKLKGKKINNKRKYYVYVVAKKKVGNNTIKSQKINYWNSQNKTKGYF